MHSKILANAAKKTLTIFLPLAVAIVFSGCKLQANRHNAYGIQAYQSGQVAQAINEFQKALTADPQNANAYYNLGASYAALGKQSKNKTWLDQSEQLYRQAISLDDQHVDAHRGLTALLVETNREKYAFDLLNTWRQRHPGQTEPLIELARLYQEYGDKHRASDLLADALKLDSNNTRGAKSPGTRSRLTRRVSTCFAKLHSCPATRSAADGCRNKGGGNSKLPCQITAGRDRYGNADSLRRHRPVYFSITESKSVFTPRKHVLSRSERRHFDSKTQLGF